MKIVVFVDFVKSESRINMCKTVGYVKEITKVLEFCQCYNTIKAIETNIDYESILEVINYDWSNLK